MCVRPPQENVLQNNYITCTPTQTSPMSYRADINGIILVISPIAQHRNQAEPIMFNNVSEMELFFSNGLGTVKKKISEEPICDENNDLSLSIFMTEIVKPGDERETTKQFEEAKKAEIDGLIDRGTFKPVEENEVTNKAIILGGRFVCTLNIKARVRMMNR